MAIFPISKPKDMEVKAAWRGVLPISGDVVVVETDTAIRHLIVEILESLRAKAVAFETAEDAVAHVLDSHIHCSLLITDHELLGNLPGEELADIFRAKWPTVPVIVTSKHSASTRHLPDKIVHLQKPWPEGKLVSIIAGLLQPGIGISKD